MTAPDLSDQPPEEGPPFRLRAHADVGVEVLHATLRTQSFDPHFHDSYLVGLTVGGAETFTQDGRPGVSLPGQVRVAEPGVVHTGAPGDGTAWRYVALYIDPAAFTGLLGDAVTPFALHRAVLTDPDLFEAGVALVEALTNSSDPVEREERLAMLLLRLASHHRDVDRIASRSEPAKITLAREYIRHRMATVVRLDELAAAVGFSKFHLLRTFKAATGLTPWRYQVQLRLSVARDLLRGGTPASQVAVICGFFDQSHFTRLFRASFGITPAAFAAAFAQ